MFEFNEARQVGARELHAATRLVFASCALWFSVLAPAPASAQEISEEWEFVVAVYAWAPDIAGNTSFPAGAGRSIDVDADEILDNLNMAALGSFGVQKGRWGAFTDLIYLDVGDSKSQTRNLTLGDIPIPASVAADTDFDLKSTIWTIGGSYRISGSQAATVDVLAGARLAALKPQLTWEFTGSFGPIVPPPLTGSAEISTDQWDGIVGVKGRVALGADRKWVVPYYFDVGTGDSDLTWQALIGLGYAFRWGDVLVAWRYLDYELKSESPISDMNFNGPAIGASFRW